MENTKQNNHKPAAIYVRVANADQIEGARSLVEQIKECTADAVNAGYDVVEIFREHAAAGGDFSERPNLTELRRWLRAGKFGAVFSLRVDRISRNVADLSVFVDECNRSGTKLEFVEDGRAGEPLSVEHYAKQIERKAAAAIDAAAIHRIFGLYLAGRSEREIVAELNG